jgi:hypothetical protein
MRESQYVEPYLSANARRGPLRGLTVNTYLAYVLGGRARRYAASYAVALRRALRWRVQAGEVICLPSAGRRNAYHRIADLPWPLAVPLEWWLRRNPTVRLEIDCTHHLRRCGIGSVSCRQVLDVCAINEAFCQKMLAKRTITLECPQGPSDPAAAVAPLLREAAQALAKGPDEPMRTDAAVIGRAAALLHARDCLHADAIIRAVTAEIISTGRVAYALRSAADPAWVLARALETAR